MLAAESLQEMQIGGYMRLNRRALEEDLKILKTLPQSEFKLSQLQLEYLQKIIDYCHQKQLKLIFLNAPMYNGGGVYYMRDEFAKIYHANYRNIPLLDYADYKLPDSCYGDASHLNHEGATIFSSFLNAKLNQSASKTSVLRK